MRIPYHNKRAGEGRQQGARKRIIKARGHKCEKCGYPGYIELHHIVEVVNGGGWSDSNLLLLCEKCHAEAHSWHKENYIDPNRESWKPS